MRYTKREFYGEHKEPFNLVQPHIVFSLKPLEVVTGGRDSEGWNLQNIIFSLHFLLQEIAAATSKTAASVWVML